MIKIYFLILLLLSSCTTVITNVTNSNNLSELNVKQIGSYKRGETCTFSVLSIGPFGNSSIIETAEKGGINKIIFVDTVIKNRILYKNICLVVYGN